MSSSRSVRGWLAWPTAVVVIMLAAAAPALTSPSYHEYDESYGRDLYGDRYVEICDRERDGVKAYARYEPGGGGAYGFGVVTDYNGADLGCGNERTADNRLVIFHEACEPNAGCRDRSSH